MATVVGFSRVCVCVVNNLKLRHMDDCHIRVRQYVVYTLRNACEKIKKKKYSGVITKLNKQLLTAALKLLIS